MSESDQEIIAVLKERVEKRKVRLLQMHKFLPAHQFSKLLTKCDINTDDILDDLLERDMVIGLKVGNEHLYPVEQVDLMLGDVHPEIPKIMTRALKMKLETWEVFDWLVRSVSEFVSGRFVGDASGISQGLNPAEIMEIIKANVARDPPVYKDVIPLELLKQKRSTDFWKLVDRWMRVEKAGF